MIASFHDTATETIWSGQFSRHPPNQIQAGARRKLRMINATQGIEDLRSLPGNRLEAQSGNRIGQWIIRINEQWRVCFVWNNGKAERVEICDYH